MAPYEVVIILVLVGFALYKIIPLLTSKKGGKRRRKK